MLWLDYKVISSETWDTDEAQNCENFQFSCLWKRNFKHETCAIAWKVGSLEEWAPGFAQKVQVVTNQEL